MSICTNFEGGLMKAIRSLEQHVDSLMSYDFTELSDDGVKETAGHRGRQANLGDCRGAKPRHVTYDAIHEITKIDVWFIDKLAILVEMEAALKKGPLTVDLLREAKRIEFPDNVIARLTGIAQEQDIHADASGQRNP